MATKKTTAQKRAAAKKQAVANPASTSVQKSDITLAAEKIVDSLGTAAATIDTGLNTAATAIGTPLDTINTTLKNSAIGQNVSGINNSLDDLNSFAFLTQEISQIRRSQGTQTGAASGSLSQTAALAVQEVLGWKPRTDNPKGFIMALNASFCCKESEGHTVCKWTPRTYAVQTDLEGGVTGAQASLYTRAKSAVDESQTLLTGLRNLRLDADPEDMEALKLLLSEQMNQLVSELGMIGGPRIQRLDQVFATLLGEDPLIVEPDDVEGQVGTVRDEFGLAAFVANEDFVNTVEEEQNLTNFRILSDYLTSLRTSWETSKRFFKRGPGATKAFFGTRLVLLTRNLTVVAESVSELRFALDSVFIGASERETLEIIPVAGDDDRLFLEELLQWIYTFASDEGPGMIQNGGKYGVQTAFLPVVTKLRTLSETAADPAKIVNPPPGYLTKRVTRSWEELIGQLEALEDLARPIDHTIPSQQGFGRGNA